MLRPLLLILLSVPLLLPFLTWPVSGVDTNPPVWPPNSRITALKITSSSIDISWTPATDDSGTVNYRVYENGIWYGMYTLSTSYGHSNLSPNQTITFEIVAVDPSYNNSTGPSATFTTAPAQCTGYEACLVSLFTFSPTSAQGGTISVNAKVTNEGQDSIMVTSVTVTGDLGAYSMTSGTQFLLRVGETGTNGITISVPLDEPVGMHVVIFTVSWEYNSSIGEWRQGPDFVRNGAFSVTGRQTPNEPIPSMIKTLVNALGGYLYLIVGGCLTVVALVSVVVGLVVRNDDKKRAAW